MCRCIKPALGIDDSAARMTGLLEATLRFPTIVFGILLAGFGGFWLIATFAGSGLDSDLDAGPDLDATGPGGAGETATDEMDLSLAGVLSAFGLEGLPITLVGTLASLFAWFTSLTLNEIIGRRPATLAILAGILIATLSSIAGLYVAGFVSRPLRSLFNPERALRTDDLVGRVCVITTGRADAEFGQAEVDVAGSSPLVVQVRADPDETFARGDRALLYARNDDHFTITAAPFIEDDTE